MPHRSPRPRATDDTRAAAERSCRLAGWRDRLSLPCPRGWPGNLPGPRQSFPVPPAPQFHHARYQQTTPARGLPHNWEDTPTRARQVPSVMSGCDGEGRGGYRRLVISRRGRPPTATAALLASSSNAAGAQRARSRGLGVSTLSTRLRAAERDDDPHQPARRSRPFGEDEPGPRQHDRGHPGDERRLDNRGDSERRRKLSRKCAAHRIRPPRRASRQRELKGDHDCGNRRIKQRCRTSDLHRVTSPDRTRRIGIAPRTIRSARRRSERTPAQLEIHETHQRHSKRECRSGLNRALRHMGRLVRRHLTHYVTPRCLATRGCPKMKTRTLAAKNVEAVGMVRRQLGKP